jgi:hypothetical protein
MASQNFLPVLSTNRIVLGAVPITSTAFTGSETTFTETSTSKTYATKSFTVPYVYADPAVAGVNVLSSATYVGIEVSTSVANSGMHVVKTAVPNMIEAIDLVPQRTWVQANGFVTEMGFLANGGSFSNFLFQLATGVQVPSTTIVAPPLATPTASNATLSWVTKVQFSNAQATSFFDVNWVEALSASSGNYEPVSASIGAPSGGIATYVRAFVVQSPSAVGRFGGVQYNVMRFIRVTSDPVPAGTYVYPITITNTDGNTVTVNLSVVVS